MKPHRVTAQVALLICATAGALTACAKPHIEAANHPNSARVVASPNGIAALSSDHATLGLPAEICFGGPLGRSALYLAFPSTWRARGTPRKAVLTLTPREGAPIDPAQVTVEAWRVTAAWQPGALHTWWDKPELAPPYARALITNSPVRELRIDVTELLRFAAQNPSRDFGIALLASGGSGHGVSFATGMNGGQAPRLELLFWL